jgi:hypothetical protein
MCSGSSTDDYNIVVAGCRRLASERDQLKLWCESLQAEMAQNCSYAEKHIANLEASVKSADACSVEIAAESEKNLRDFESELVRKLEGLHEMYADKVQIIGGLCSPISMEEPSVEDCLNWLSEEVASLPDMFCGVNEIFATAAIEGALVLAGDSVDLEAVWVVASEGGADILPAGSSVRKAARAVSKKWWCSFGYDYVLSVIRTQQAKVLSYFLFWLGTDFLPCCCFVLLYDENKEVDNGAPVETTLAGNVEEAVDAEVARVAAEKHPEPDGFASSNNGHGGGYHDTDEG